MLTAVSYGGGTNSTALLVGMVERGERPDFVLFADTGGELPRTYSFLATMSDYLHKHFGYHLWQVTNGGRGQGDTLEENCLMRHELPSLAYGFKGCSVKWKRQPMDRWLRDRPECIEAWNRGEKITRCIGIDIGERHRATLTEDAKFVYRYPLIEWEWDRKDCVAAIERAGLPQPGKTSCFFCPAMRRSEILELAKTHPDLFARAVEMERNSKAHTVKGLGRDWSWEAMVKADRAQLKLFPETMDQPCGCHDDSE